MHAISTEIPWIVLFISFVTIFMFCLGVSQLVRQKAARRNLIIKIKMGDHGATENQKIGDFEPEASFTFLNAVSKVGRIAPIGNEELENTARLRFLRAGIRNDNAFAAFWGCKILLAFFLPAFFLVSIVLGFSLLSQQIATAVAVLLALLGFYLPDIWLRQRSDVRKQKILASLPDALDLLVVCVEAGMGLDSAIQRVGQELKQSNPEISDEFQFMNLELRAGKQRHDALKNLAKRTNITEIESLVTLLVQTDQFGTSMADALRVYSDSFRTQRYQRAEEIAAKLPVKMLLPLGFFIFPALLVVILGPAGISIYKVFIAK